MSCINQQRQAKEIEAEIKLYSVATGQREVRIGMIGAKGNLEKLGKNS